MLELADHAIIFPGGPGVEDLANSCDYHKVRILKDYR
jgi:phosphoserine phosphatase